MRVALIFALLVVFAVFVQGKERDEKHHGKHRSKQHENRKKQREEHYKAHEKTHHERMKFGHFKHLKHRLTNRAGGNNTISINGSYVKDYAINDNTTVTIVYNATGNFIGVYNPTKLLASVYASNQTLVGIYNITSQCVLTINTQTQQAGLIQNISIDFKNRTVILKSFSELYDLVVGNPPGGIGGNSTQSFDFNGLINAFLSGNLTAIFQQQAGQLQQNVIKAFFGFFTNIQASWAAGIRGIGGIFAQFFGVYGKIASGVAGAFTSVIKSGAKLSWDYVTQFFKGLGSGFQFFRAAYLNALNTAVANVGKLYENFAAAVQAFASGKFFQNITSQLIPYSGGSNATVVGGVTSENDWLINVIDENGAVNMSVDYNATGNIFGLYNAKLTIATVSAGDNLFALSNTTSGAILVVNQVSGLARFLPANATIADAFKGKVNVKYGFTLIADAILAHCNNLDFPLNFEQDVFSFRVLVFALRAGLDLGTAFIGKGALQISVIQEYGALFADARASFAKDPFSIIKGVFGVLSPLFGFPGQAAKFFFQFFGRFVNGTLGAIQAGPRAFFSFFGNITQALGGFLQLPPSSGNVGFHFAWGNSSRTTHSI